MAERKTKDIMQQFAIKQALSYLEKDPEKNAIKLMDMVDRFSPSDWYAEPRKAIRTVLEEKNNWYDLVLRIYELDSEVRKTFFENFIFNSALKGSAIQEEMSEKYNCNVPWAILMDPTSACNLKCTGYQSGRLRNCQR